MVVSFICLIFVQDKNISMKAIKITDQNEMIEIGHTFLHQETQLTQQEVSEMDEFDVYYETRELVKNWNQLPNEQLENKILSLEVQGFNVKQ